MHFRTVRNKRSIGQSIQRNGHMSQREYGKGVFITLAKVENGQQKDGQLHLENQDRTWKAFEKESGILFQGAIFMFQVSFW